MNVFLSCLTLLEHTIKEHMKVLNQQLVLQQFIYNKVNFGYKLWN